MFTKFKTIPDLSPLRPTWMFTNLSQSLCRHWLVRLQVATCPGHQHWNLESVQHVQMLQAPESGPESVAGKELSLQQICFRIIGMGQRSMNSSLRDGATFHDIHQLERIFSCQEFLKTEPREWLPRSWGIYVYVSPKMWILLFLLLTSLDCFLSAVKRFSCTMDGAGCFHGWNTLRGLRIDI